MAKLDNLALGSYEAACLMGVHFTRPARMFQAGLIDGREVEGVRVGEAPRTFLIYSQASCEKDWREYDETRKGRPRAWEHLRPEALRRLKAVKQRITYEDAIGVAEAAKILGVHYTMIYKLIAGGKLEARAPWSDRYKSGQRLYIISRKSCEANRREVAAAEKAGTKRGRKRYA